MMHASMEPRFTLTFESNAEMLANSGRTGKSKDLVQPAPKKNNVFWGNYDASNPVESSGIVGKNFPFDLRIEALHRFEPGNRVELA